VQTLALPCTGILPVICAVITCSATIKMWDEAYWQPAEILAHWDNRGAVFIAAVVWIIATIGVNLSANTITVAIALSSFWPRYINNIRGSLIVAVLSVIICPWKIVYSAGSFYSELKPGSSTTRGLPPARDPGIAF
jgi:NCS1 family nucleobase:cation symporter-1